MTIGEPATLVTDYLLALFTGVLGGRLKRASVNAEWAGFAETADWQQWWWVAFMATAIASAAGGTVHGFQHAMARPVADLLWLVALEGLVVAAFAVVSAAIVLLRWRRIARFSATYAAAVAFGSYGLWMIRNPVFLAAIAAYAVALVFLVAVRLSVRRLDGGGGLLLAGVALSAAAAVVQQSGWSIHRSFNHNDLYHVIQAVAIWLLYRAAIATDAPAG
jgi:hypothetical protein